MRNSTHFVQNYLHARYGWRFKSRALLDAYQQQKLENFRRKCLKKSHFYQSYLNKDFPDFPLMNKALMMSHFDDINTCGIKLKDAMHLALEAEETRNFGKKINGITIGLSSGTSGNRGLFTVSDKERARWAGVMLARALDTSILGNHKLAFFLRAGSNLYDSVHKRGRLSFRFFDLTQPFNGHLSALNDMQPTQIIAPARVLCLIAQMQKQGKINIHPRRITSVAEVLDPLDAKTISDVFAQPVHQIYQCTEGFLGYTCEHNNLHLNEEYLLVEKEWIDRTTGRFSPVITDFSRTTQPIVRYKLDDILVLDERPCPCGRVSTVITLIEGRMDDLLYGQSHNCEKQIPIFPDQLRQLVIRSSPSISDYRIVQESLGTIRIEVQDLLSATDWGKLILNLNTAFIDHGCIPPSFIRDSLKMESLLQKQRRIRRSAFS